MVFQVLGNIAIVHSGELHSPYRAQRRGLLAFLLLNANQVVSNAQITEAIWGPTAPATARAQVASAIHSIRVELTGLGLGHLLSRGPGYSFTLDPGQLDLLAFRCLNGQARAARLDGRPLDARRLIRAGLALWQGPALGDASGAYVEAARANLDDRYASTVEELIDTELALGAHRDVIEEFGPLTVRYPLRERLRGQIMLALYRSDNQTDALRHARELRSQLAEEHGVDPGRRFVELEHAIRRMAPALDLGGATAARGPIRPPATRGSRPRRNSWSGWCA